MMQCSNRGSCPFIGPLLQKKKLLGTLDCLQGNGWVWRWSAGTLCSQLVSLFISRDANMVRDPLHMNTTGMVMKLQRLNGENELMEKGGAGGRRSKKVPKSL